jgi:hypothetical protein
MNLPKYFIKNRLFEVGITFIRKPRKKLVEFYHRKLAWWINVYGIRFKHFAFYTILKKTCI